MSPNKVKDYERLLKRPFPVAAVSFRKGPGSSKELAYITARDVMQRLDEVFGVDGWEDSYDYVGGRMICTLRCRFGSEWVSKSDGADDSQIEGAKGGISDSLKRASVKYGIFRYAYHPGAFNGRTPAAWATPEGYDKIMDERDTKGVVEFKKAMG